MIIPTSQPSNCTNAELAQFTDHTMEPAGCGLATLSLAIELVHSVVKIKHFFDTLSQVPSELNRLQDLIDQTHDLSNVIRTLLDSQSGIGLQEDCVSGLRRALQSCRRSLLSIQNVLPKGDIDGKNRISGWTKFRLACKTREIEKLESRLAGSLDFLHFSFSVYHAL